VKGFQVFVRPVSYDKGHKFLSVRNSSTNDCKLHLCPPCISVFPPLPLKDNPERLQEQLNPKAFSIFSRFSKSPKIICVNCVSIWKMKDISLLKAALQQVY